MAPRTTRCTARRPAHREGRAHRGTAGAVVILALMGTMGYVRFGGEGPERDLATAAWAVGVSLLFAVSQLRSTEQRERRRAEA